MHAIAITVLSTISIALVALQIYVILRFKLPRASVKRITRVARVALAIASVTVTVALAIAIAPTAAHALFMLALAIPSIAMFYALDSSAVRIARIARIARASTQRVTQSFMHVVHATRLA